MIEEDNKGTVVIKPPPVKVDVAFARDVRPAIEEHWEPLDTSQSD